jgi:ribonuclease Z
VLNCPSPDFIQPLIDQFAHGTWYSKFGMDLPDEHKVRTVFHVCGRGVMEDYRYREFMHFFPADVQVCHRPFLSWIDIH